MPLEPGQSLSHYRLLSKIGAGGMGEVYLAEDTTLKRKVALKVLPAAMANDPSRLERFQREAEAIAALNHPSIVTIYSVERHEATRFLTMELVEGDSLDHRVTPGGLGLPEVFDIGIAIADALAAAHDKGIVHRDLKPANVMVTRNGRVKVLDFGLAKLAADTEPDSVTEAATRHASLTGEGMVVGTVPYMSPEQLSGKDVDHRTDIFSLGVLLYELAVGRRPFAGETSAIITSSILRDTPRPVHEVREDVPRHLGRIIGRCLEKDPEARFQTAKDVRNELRGLRKEVESGASGQSRVMSAAAGPAAESPASAPGSAPASVTSGVAAAAGGSRQWLWAVGGAVVVVALGAVFWLGRSSQGQGPGAATVEKTASLAPAGGGSAVTETNSLAVLPFTNMSADEDQEYFSDGLTEELMGALGRIPDLRVAGRTSSFVFKGKTEDLRSVGEKLGVANILEGSVRKVGNQIRVSVQLVKAADGFQLWSETYNRTLDDVFAVQDDIAQSVAQALQVTLMGKGPAAENPDAEAYDLVLRARFVMQDRSKEAVSRARGLIERALEMSPDYAPAWTEMGLVHMRAKERATTVEASQQALERTRSALLRALELDPDLAVAHSRMAGVYRDSWDFEAAERSTERALTADPKNVIVLGNAAYLYKYLGKLQKAITLEEQSFEIDPLDLVGMTNLASTYTQAGRLEDAETLCRKALEMNPDDSVSHLCLAQIHLLRGETEEAKSSFARFNDLAGYGDYIRLWSDALVHHTAGDAQASRKAAEEFERRFGADDSFSCAEVRAWRGETDAAFAWLDKALAAHDPYMASLKSDIFLNSLHTDPRWNSLLKSIGLPTD